ncbi:sensor histidine kinase [Devosia sp. YR412]|uniref:sensor histidine kinase n=1 Tax=Devosia sp. YR412 TaxID=1881030 RepID=UPI00147E655C|nr:sensor histidine kinase [Devosia sp. YR412]
MTRLRALSAGLRQRGISVLHQLPDRSFDLAENLPDIWPVHDILGITEADAFPPHIATSYRQAFDDTHRNGQDQSFEFELGDGLRRQVFEARLQPDETGVLSIIADVTEARSRDNAVSALLREVSHRSKNLLAIVQSVAMQTANHSTTIQDFLDKFRGRLHALSSTQDLVTESNWRGTYLQSLITAQLTRVGSSHLAHVRITGENPLLGPNASLHIGLAIHELGANAVLHGALAEDRPGQVWVDAQIVAHPGQPADLVIEWQEAGIEVGDAQQQPRFGTLVLERIVPLSVGGSAQFHVEADSVRYRLVVPADQFEV